MKLLAILAELVRQLPDYQLVGSIDDIEITGVAYDSRRVEAGNLFVCIPGYRYDGHSFAQQAVAAGAYALVVERELIGLAVPQIVVGDARESMGLIAAAFWGYPSRSLRIIGVTGTNGKTTTTYLVKSVLEEAGYKVGLVGTIKNLIGDQEVEAARTTPESSDLQALFAQMLQAGVSHVVMEVSSHAVSLKRISGTEFDTGIFTNITQDHLDFHKNFDNYLLAKAQFFARIGQDAVKAGAKTVVLNGDDHSSSRIAEYVHVPTLTYGIKEESDLRAGEILLSQKGIEYMAHTPSGTARLQLKLLGEFNVYNSLAAVGAGLAEGISLDIIVRALGKAVGVRGRAELVDEGQDFAVVVDYAHTPDGLENILRTARGFTKNRLSVVFGCGGDRDRTKRPLMGQVAGSYADYTIITSDNPRSEEPAAICEDIVPGLEETAAPGSYQVVVDRRQAIAQALANANPGDVVVIAGKGHEDYQIFKDKVIHFDDREEAAIILKSLLQRDA